MKLRSLFFAILFLMLLVANAWAGNFYNIKFTVQEQTIRDIIAAFAVLDVIIFVVLSLTYFFSVEETCQKNTPSR